MDILNARPFRTKSGRGLGFLNILNARSFTTPLFVLNARAFATCMTHSRCPEYPERTCIQDEITTRLRRPEYHECVRSQDAAHPSLMRAHSGYSGRIQDVRNNRRKESFSETDELPRISIKFRKIVDNLPPFGETLFRTLIAAWSAPFS